VEAPGVERSRVETGLDPPRTVSPELSAAYVELVADPRRVEQALDLFRCSTVVRRIERALEALEGGQTGATRALLVQLRADLDELDQRASAMVAAEAPCPDGGQPLLRLRRRSE